jgi:hypothetical protein
MNLSPARGRCVTLSLFRPGTRSFSAAAPVHVVPCGGYFAYTPGPGAGGRHTLLVTATDERPGRQRYHLQAALEGPDDMSPGLPLANLQTRTGTLSATRIDVVDLYRFCVENRSEVVLTLRAFPASRLVLLNENGRVLSSSDGPGALTATLGRGLFYVAVRATGRWARPLPALAPRAAADDDDHPRERFAQRDRPTGFVGRDRRGRELQPGRTDSPANRPL